MTVRVVSETSPLFLAARSSFSYSLYTMALDSQREEIPRISVETFDDWRRIKRNYTLAALTALDEQLSGNNSAEDRQVLLAHLHRVCSILHVPTVGLILIARPQFIDKTFELTRPNVRVNGQNLEELNEDEVGALPSLLTYI